MPGKRERMDNNRRKLSFLGFNPSRVSTVKPGDMVQCICISWVMTYENMIAKVNTNVQQKNNNSIVVQLVLKNSYLPLMNDPTLSVLTKKCNSIDI